MAAEILLPKIGFSMTEGTLAEWLAEDGAKVNIGDPLLTIESEKSTTEIESPATGILRTKAAPGDTLPVGAVLGTIS